MSSSSSIIHQSKEKPTSSSLTNMTSIRSQVDTRRPFRSVKEAVAVFGEHILMNPEPPPPPSPSYSTSSSRFNQDRDEEHLNAILISMKKLEAELMETKSEVALLKKMVSETKIVVEKLNAELHKSKMEMEVASGVLIEKQRNLNLGSDRWSVEKEEEIMEVKNEYLPSFASVARLGENHGDEANRKRVKKKKPVVPLIGDMFLWKKDSGEMGDSLYSKSYFSAA